MIADVIKKGNYYQTLNESGKKLTMYKLLMLVICLALQTNS